MRDTIALIGAGGIGSWTAFMLHHLIVAKQLHGKDNTITPRDVTVFDNDVVERKNLRHQLFHQDEVGMPKSLLMTARFGFKSVYRRFDKADLDENFGIFLLAVDNAATRKLVYDYALPARRPFIDMRAEGRMFAVFTHRCDKETLYGSLGTDPADGRGYSCQVASDVVVNQVNLANFSVPSVGLQLLLDHLRGFPIPGRKYYELNGETT